MSGQATPDFRPCIFGAFSFEEATGELRKHGVRVRLQGQPLRILSALIRQPGSVITRDELHRELWSGSTFVDFDHGLNSAMTRLRQALGDSAEKPRYVETLPGRGYRFIAALQDPNAKPSLVVLPAVSGLEPDDRSGMIPNSPGEGPALVKRIAATALLAVLLAAGVWMAGPNPRYSQPPRYERISHRRGVIQSARLTPDGLSVIYAASWDGQPIELFSHQLGSPETRSLGFPSTGLLAVAGTGKMAVSTNCALQWTYDCVGTLAEMSLNGGAPREILDRVQFADWARDGKRLAVTVNGETGNGETGNGEMGARLEFPKGHVIFRATGTGWPGDPRVSPSGEYVAFADHYYSGDDGSISVVDLRGAKRTLTPIFDTLQGLAWSPNGKEIWFTGAAGPTALRQLRAVTLSGSMRVVAQLPNNLKLHDIAADGRVLLSTVDSNRRVYFMGPGDSRPRDLTWFDWAVRPILSADGKTLLITENDESTGGKDVIYLRGTDGSPVIRLGENTGISLSPDGQWVATTTGSRSERPDITLLPVKAGAPIPIDTGALQLTGGTLPALPGIGWFPDSKRILFPAKQPGREARTFVRDLRGGQPRPITPEGIWGSLLTPDGLFLLVYDSRSNAFLFPIDGGTPRPLPFLTADYKAINFSTDGRFLYVIKRAERSPKVWRMDVASGRTGIWTEIPVGDPTSIVSAGTIQITPDGKSMAYSFRNGLTELYVAHGLQ